MTIFYLLLLLNSLQKLTTKSAENPESSWCYLCALGGNVPFAVKPRLFLFIIA
ncbi:hypothetical protein CLDAP_03670 [Caldilinea aerophila DSM 14535 = NBRC 104270]|uniref:Uncharacterized protein n=1 Tax=Caldilinea aerophila (strain DSM 14535 / JCM 11387 / NBRC 104270 / STL-6-O1) TaxID=926550 RepID=I0HZG9_CALAS|nr:hypothetical protein CLDAP_03670 [Caldilinea aerophila DSM 14535 = NBRC 104270]